MKKKAKDKPHYVDNKKFLQAMIDWRETWPDEDNKENELELLEKQKFMHI